ncbi:RDD family protein [Aliikangiella sp. G2MR2-5]|uniref:RDD family protein n=1 Tax=Aliikangiella sp. G2MR2-5 TaxID=2788943 RepID=UPI0018A95675|nr:RDD family protein [Aliikangiella sp. G2MR2-5]
MSSKAKTAPPPQKMVEVTLASCWKRIIAWVYDLLGGLAVFILALVIGLLASTLIALPFGYSGAEVSQSLSNNPLWLVYIFACVQYYYVWCWVKGGQTVGMRTWRLKLCKPDGQLLTWQEGYIRSFASLGGIGTLWCIVDKENRGLQDLACDSRVVLLPKESRKKEKPLL